MILPPRPLEKSLKSHRSSNCRTKKLGLRSAPKGLLAKYPDPLRLKVSP
jgi:hypothetical protein